MAEVYDAIGIEPAFLMGNFEGPAQLGPIVNGCLAISGGLARHVVVYRTVTEGSARRAIHEGHDRSAAGRAEWITALGGGPAPIGYALLARRHFHDYGTSRQQLGADRPDGACDARLNPRRSCVTP